METPTPEEVRHDKKLGELLGYQADPFGPVWLTNSVARILDELSPYETYLPLATLSKWIAAYWTASAEKLSEVDPVSWERGLRRYLLNKLKTLTDECPHCELAANRLPGRGSVPGDGDVDAELFVCGEGPGAFEQRTTLPLTGSIELRGSTCVKCLNYERCYLDVGGNYVRTPQYPCDYQPAEIAPEIMQNRLRPRSPGTNTAGEFVSDAMKRAGVVRPSFVRLLRMQQQYGMAPPEVKLPKPNVFITNATKCRCTKVDENGRTQNAPPETRHVEACRPWLKIQLALVRPVKVLGTGNKALEALESKPKDFKISEACGPGNQPVPVVSGPDGRKNYVCLHPAYWMRFLDAEKPPHIARLEFTLREIMKDVKAELERQGTRDVERSSEEENGLRTDEAV